MAECLTFVSTSPILLVIIFFFTRKRPTISEIAGVLIGFSGLLMIVFGSGSSKGGSLFGDLISLISALGLTIYLLCGRKALKQGVFLWIYMFPINLQAAVWSYLMGISVEQADP